MHILSQHTKLILLLSIFALASSLTWAAEIAGHVIVTKGNVTALLNGEPRDLKRRGKIFTGDIITTGPKSSVQVRFIDKALMTLKANTQLDISTYVFKEKEEKVLMNLVKGGFRTITGSIGKGDKSAYKVYTPIASVGIRGTNYEVQEESSGSFVMAVYQGGITVENEQGSIDLGFDSSFNFTRVQPGEAPKGLLLAPSSLGSITEQSDDEDDEIDEEESTEDTADDEQEEDSQSNNDESNEEPSDDTSSDNEQTASPPATQSTSTSETNTDDAIGKKLEGEQSQDGQTPISSESNQTFAQTFFDFPYTDVADFENKFPQLLSDNAYNLAESGNIGSLNMQLNYQIGTNGLPDFTTQMSSSIPITANNFFAFDYTSNNASFDIDFETIDSLNDNNFFTVTVTVNLNVNNLQTLVDHINDELDFYNAPVSADIISSIDGDRIVISPNGTSPDYIAQMEITFNAQNNVETQQLMSQMGTDLDDPNNDWYWDNNTNLALKDGSWEIGENTAIISSIQRDDDPMYGPQFYGEIATKQNGEKVNNYDDFMDCLKDGDLCDIQVTNVAAAEPYNSNIAWGAWLAKPDNGLLLSVVSEGLEPFEESIHQDHLFAFWLLAERADLNTLQGTGTFSSANLDCLDYRQCFGFADDGAVTDISGSFDVNFSNGNISNGNLSIHTQGASHWQVNFNGYMMMDENSNVNAPEFHTQNISGSIYDDSGSQISSDVVGNVGGIFAKPGNVFGGGFNLGTADPNDKHAAGVFTLEKE